jgi:hemerythrin
MSKTNQFAFIIIIQAAFLAVFLQRAPFMMTTITPSARKPWADQPCKLVTTPQHATNKTDIFTTGATHMAHIHNAIFRGYNSIYLQSPHVKEEDKAAFIGYALTWYRFVKSHHDDEEAQLFPKVAQVLGGKDEEIWGETHKEHESFLPGLSEYATYLESLATPTDFDGNELRRIMDGFQKPFEHHFHSEISHIASFASLPGAPAPNSPEESAAAAVFKAWGKKTVTKAGTTDVVPFFLMNLDATYEEGKWANWPPMPAPIRWGLVNLAGSWNWGWWKFASCDAQGKPRELYALEDEEVKK